MIRHARQLVTAALGTAILLTACTGAGGLKALDRAATAEGALPASVSVAEANPESVRLLADTGGVKYFGAKGENGSLGCIVVFPTAKPEQWVPACASRPTNGEIVTVSGPDVVILLLVGELVAVPVAVVAHFMISQAVGRATVAKDAEGRERAVYWRDHPGIAGLDPQDVLQGPTPEEGYAAGQGMVAEIRAALTRELQLEWAPAPEKQDDVDPSVERIQNYFGGESLLTVVNAPASQSTSVPRAWAGKQRAIRIIGEVTGRYGYSAPVLDSFDLWSEEDRIRDLGRAAQETPVLVSGAAHGPTGQWLVFAFQDLSKDRDGSLRERLSPPAGSDWQLEAISISYAANGLLPEADREEFKARLEPFAGLTPHAPLET